MKPDEVNKVLLDLRKQAETEFEKLIIYIASGGLVLTISFSEKIVKIDQAGLFLNWLISTWICFAFTILISLVFHFTSIKAIDLHLAKKIRQGRKWNNTTKFLHLLSIIVLLYGISCFIMYAILSLKKF